jgi:hypothetical protein
MTTVFRNAAYERTPKALTGAELKTRDKLVTIHLDGVGDSWGEVPKACGLCCYVLGKVYL